VSVSASGTLSGSGTVADVSLSGTIAPGSSVGTINTANETWSGGGHYTWEMNQGDGTAGIDPGWDKVNITGTLTITATPTNKFTIDVASLTGSVAGPAANFTTAGDPTWTILTASGGITGFDPGAFTTTSTAFSNSLAGAQFAVTTNGAGNSLILYLYFPPQNLVSTVAGAGTFTGKPNTGYVVKYTDNLTPPITWQTLTTVGSSGTVTTDGSGVGSFVDPGPLPVERYYRILLP
jgi:hypothetical protein